MQVSCPACGHQAELQVVNLDSDITCPRCGDAQLEPVTDLDAAETSSAAPFEREEFSHRLRTPLTVVKGSLQHLIKHWDDLADRDRKVLVKAVLDQSDAAIDAIALLEDRLSAGERRDTVLPQAAQTSQTSVRHKTPK